MPQVASEAQAINPSSLRPKATHRASHGAGHEAASPFSSFFEHTETARDNRRVDDKRSARTDNRRDTRPVELPQDPQSTRDLATRALAGDGPVRKDTGSVASNPSDDSLQPPPSRDDKAPLAADGVDGVKTGDAAPPDGVDGIKTGDAPPPDPAVQTGDAAKQADSTDAADDLAAQQLAEALAANPAPTDPAPATVVPAAPQPVATPIIDARASTGSTPDAGSKAQISTDRTELAVDTTPADIGDESATAVTAAASKTDKSDHADARQAGAAPKSAEHATTGEQRSEPTGIKAASLPEQAGRGQSEAAAHHAAHSEKPAGQQATANRPDADAIPAASPPPGLQTTPGAGAAAVANVHGMQVSATAYAADHGKTEQTKTVPLEGLGVEIAVRAKSGKNQFDIRLDPPELGRIEVRLHVDDKGQVTSRLVADRLDTLDLLRRDAAGLERALQDAGLKTSSNGMQFSLRDHGGGQQGRFDQPSGRAQVIVTDDTPAVIDTTQRQYRGSASLRGGLDIRV